MAWISSSLRASTSIARCWRASHRPISSGFLSGAQRFSTVPPDLDLAQHIQSHHDFFGPPVSICNTATGGSEKGTLTLRRKCKGEIIIVDIRAVDEGRILDELVEYEVAEGAKSLKQTLVESCQYDFEESMKIFDDEKVGNVEEVGYIGCLVLTVCVYYGNVYCRRIKMDVFAFLDQISVPGITLTDNSCKGFETLETFFKDREIHIGTMNFLINYAKQFTVQEEEVKHEPVPKVFGLFDKSQMKEAIREAENRVTKEFLEMAKGVVLNPKKT